jgi:NNP family nitrate/nitrite transporter-like MFS transporter
LNFLSRIVFAPLMPVIEEDLKLGHNDAGFFFLLISIGYSAGLLGSGFVSSYFTNRKTIILSLLAVGGTLLATSLSQNLSWIYLSLLFLGMAAGFYLPSGIATLAALVDSRDWGKALGVHELAPILGFIAAPILAEVLQVWFSWRVILALLGGCSVLIGITFGCLCKDGEFPGEAPSLGILRLFLAQPTFWIIIVLLGFGIGANQGVYNMLPLYLISKFAMNRGSANTLLALSRISGLAMALVAGWATDRLGPTRALKVIFLVIGIFTILLGMVQGPWIVVLIFLQPVLVVCFWPAGFATLSWISPPGVRNAAVSLTVPAAYLLGAGAIPAGIGLLGEAGYFAQGIALVGVFLVVSVMLLQYLGFPDHQKEGNLTE